MNGGAGRVIASIPAFEKLYENDQDFIIVCEGGMDFYKGHPQLHELAYDCLLYTSPSQRDGLLSRLPSSA